MKNKIYLDYNATAPMRSEILAHMSACMSMPHNASSVHSFGREGRKMVEHAREQIAALVNIPATQIIFNSGATEANNTVLHHFKDERILVSAIEHPSVLEAASNAERIPVTKDGAVDLNALEEMLRTHSSPVCAKEDKPALVSVMAVNNETGVIQPIEKISALAHSNGALFHCDAVQAAGRLKLDMPAMGIDFLTLSSHKIGGPQGVGALALGLCGITPTLLRGGGQEKRARAGTENVAGICGFGLAAQKAREELKDYQKLSKLRDDLEARLQALSPGLTIHGKNAQRVANTSLFSLAGLSAETLIMAFDLEGIALSNGSACSSGRVELSHVLKAMNVSESEARAALRVSLGWDTKPSDIETFLAAWQKITARMKDKTRA